METRVPQNVRQRRSRTSTGRFVRTGLSGILATFVDVSMLVVGVEFLGWSIAFAAFFGALCGAVVNYLVNKYWAFQCPDPFTPSQLVRYAVVSLGTAAFMSFAVSTLAAYMPYVGAKAIAAIFVFLAWTYPLQAKFVFPNAVVTNRR